MSKIKKKNIALIIFTFFVLRNIFFLWHIGKLSDTLSTRKEGKRNPHKRTICMMSRWYINDVKRNRNDKNMIHKRNINVVPMMP